MRKTSAQTVSRWYVLGLANVDDIDTVGASLPQVRLHVHLEVLGSEMALGGEEHLDVLLRRVEDGGEVVGSHLDGFVETGELLWMGICEEQMCWKPSES